MVSFEPHLGDADRLEIVLRDGARWIRCFNSGDGESHYWMVFKKLGVGERVVASAGHSDESASRG